MATIHKFLVYKYISIDFRAHLRRPQKRRRKSALPGKTTEVAMPTGPRTTTIQTGGKSRVVVIITPIIIVVDAVESIVAAVS